MLPGTSVFLSTKGAASGELALSAHVGGFCPVMLGTNAFMGQKGRNDRSVSCHSVQLFKELTCAWRGMGQEPWVSSDSTCWLC